jgi:hypothetical protein
MWVETGVTTRLCECPEPAGGGLDCEGNSTLPCQDAICPVSCIAGTYSSTGSYIPGSSLCTPCPRKLLSHAPLFFHSSLGVYSLSQFVNPK